MTSEQNWIFFPSLLSFFRGVADRSARVPNKPAVSTHGGQRRWRWRWRRRWRRRPPTTNRPISGAFFFLSFSLRKSPPIHVQQMCLGYLFPRNIDMYRPPFGVWRASKEVAALRHFFVLQRKSTGHSHKCSKVRSNISRAFPPSNSRPGHELELEL